MSKISVMEETKKNLEQYQGKYLTFKLASEEYGLEIMKVREIIGIMDITKLPRTPDFVKGVINLRGKVIPVVDLRLKFGLEEIDYTDKTCIIVVEIGGNGDTYQMGIIVDAVSEVMNVSIDELEPTPRFGVTLDTEYILGMAKGKDSVRTLLDIDKVLGAEELAAIQNAI
jgi:purine-binding chemotaxis protein CheW